MNLEVEQARREIQKEGLYLTIWQALMRQASYTLNKESPTTFLIRIYTILIKILH